LKKTGELEVTGHDVYVGDLIKISDGQNTYITRVTSVGYHQDPNTLSTTVTVEEEVPENFGSNAQAIVVNGCGLASMPDVEEQRLDEQKHPMTRTKGDWKTT
jgi:hypothetical protein